MRRVAAALAIVALAAALALWPVLLDDSAEPTMPRPAAAPAPADRAQPPKPAEKKPKTRRFTVSVSGDLLMHSPLLARALANGGGESYDFAPFFEAIEPYVRGVDLAVCHLETPLGPGPPATYPVFNTPIGLAASIERSGWDACSTASNHSLDQGIEGIRDTVRALDDQGLEHSGSFATARAERRPTILRVDGVKLGYLSYTDATNGFIAPSAWALDEYAAADPAAGARAIIEDARRAQRAGADAVIVNIHWGDEYSSEPNSSQRVVAKRLTASPLIAAVVGQHPHVVQAIERINDKFVVFSEGNLVSNQGTASGLPVRTQDGLVALLDFRARRGAVEVRRVRYVPVWVRPGDYAVLPADPAADPDYADALRESRARTLATVGEGDGIEAVSE